MMSFQSNQIKSSEIRSQTMTKQMIQGKLKEDCQALMRTTRSI
jgi:hypothetical protein